MSGFSRGGTSKDGCSLTRVILLLRHNPTDLHFYPSKILLCALLMHPTYHRWQEAAPYRRRRYVLIFVMVGKSKSGKLDSIGSGVNRGDRELIFL
jgi:hypothetical protein